VAHYFLTGTAGFIAARVAELLLDEGHTVIGLDNINTAYDVNLKEWRLNRLKGNENFIFVKGDIVNRETLGEIWEAHAPFDAVINLAAQAGVRRSVKDPWIYVDTNATGTLNLLDLCQRYQVSKFVLASTSSLYGVHNTMPYDESGDTSRPLSPYAASKKAAEALSFSYHHLYDLDVTVFRYFTVYGPAGRPDMSALRFVQWISEDKPLTVYGDGKQSRDFTYVDDIARGTIAGLRPLGYEIINLGSDHPLVLMDVIRKIEAQIGKKANIVYEDRHIADVNATWANIEKAEELLNWRPQISIDQGIARLVEWYQANRDWAKDIDTGS
jgi:UDP-glucuronate 4-epimerase